jgi:hypothetical protein
VEVDALAAKIELPPSHRGDHRHLADDQISIVLVFRKTVFDRHIATFGVAGFA